jgi:hypothetical protein
VPSNAKLGSPATTQRLPGVNPEAAPARLTDENPAPEIVQQANNVVVLQEPAAAAPEGTPFEVLEESGEIKVTVRRSKLLPASSA